jgi:hypothetical protein
MNLNLGRGTVASLLSKRYHDIRLRVYPPSPPRSLHVTCQFCQFRVSSSSATNPATMSWMDLCGISNVKWGLSPLSSQSTAVEDKLQSGHLTNVDKPQKIETQKAAFTNLELFQWRGVQTDRLKHPLQTERYKSASRSASTPP